MRKQFPSIKWEKDNLVQSNHSDISFIADEKSLGDVCVFVWSPSNVCVQGNTLYLWCSSSVEINKEVDLNDLTIITVFCCLTSFLPGVIFSVLQSCLKYSLISKMLTNDLLAMDILLTLEILDLSADLVIEPVTWWTTSRSRRNGWYNVKCMSSNSFRCKQFYL